MSKEEETKNKLQQITAQSKTIEVMDQEFEIKPLTNDEFLKIAANERLDKSEMVNRIVHTILQKDDDTIELEHVRESPPGVTIAVMEAMEEVNGLEDFMPKPSENQ